MKPDLNAVKAMLQKALQASVWSKEWDATLWTGVATVTAEDGVTVTEIETSTDHFNLSGTFGADAFASAVIAFFAANAQAEPASESVEPFDLSQLLSATRSFKFGEDRS